jgi:hypothetical protein
MSKIPHSIYLQPVFNIYFKYNDLNKGNLFIHENFAEIISESPKYFTI